ncbi:MAG: ATP-binding protein [Clostridia bacterium]|nr:ATP-binding protein [Clostridia bacterium]
MKFLIPAKEESLPYISEVCTGILKKSGIGHQDSSKTLLAIEEAAINIVKYAYDPGIEGDIELEFSLSDEKFSVYVRDQGKGIDPGLLKIYDVDDEESIISSHGRGFFLMQAMTDEFQIDSIPGRGTTIFLSKHLGGLECL